ncbi:N-acetylglucosamine-binding protein GbpA [Roseateles sp.]|uniref:N-acetylglucosamine-binding protein GbpA n=1 Tax=Roseateles sp. TaxID=1971397 RepID=UPI003BA569B4
MSIERTLPQLLLVLATLSASQLASAHGYISVPESRAALCRSGGNSACGAVQWEPQSLEGPSGYPDRGPADGQLASAGLVQFAPLDEQTASRWTKRPMQAGLQTFSWTLTANHVTRNWRYYITKPNWNPNLRLTRAAFENQPFCVADGGMRQPARLTTHQCQVPPRNGYQLILGVWEIGDTPNTFYNVIDVMFQDGGPVPPTPPQATWQPKGMIFPSVDLKAGDKVATRVFDGNGERPDLQTRLAINNDTEGERNTWPFLLASRVNAEQALLRAGQMAANGTITAVQSQNEVFVRKDSGLSRVEVQVDKAPPPVGADLLVAGLGAQHSIPSSGPLSLSFSLTAVGEIEVSASVFDHGGQTKGMSNAKLNNSGQSMRISIDKPQAGHHQLVIKGLVKGSGALIQKTYDLMFVAKDPGPPAGGSFDYRFPDGLKNYKAGTRVVQPKNGVIYTCRAWPNSGYCTQWSTGATQFEPGVGSHWQEAWIAR